MKRSTPTTPQPYATRRLTEPQFIAAVEAARARVTHGRKLSAEGEAAARLVLLDPWRRQADVARELGYDRQQVNRWVSMIVIEHERLTNAA